SGAGAQSPPAAAQSDANSASPKTSQPSPAPPPTTPPDIDKTKDGGMVRGTISELVRNDHVSISLVSGESRRFSMSDVVYAGPAAAMPATTMAGPAPRPIGPAPIPDLLDVTL